MTEQQEFFATTASEFVDLLVDELAALGAEDVRPARAGVRFKGSMTAAYRACMWSRIATRVLVPLASFTAEDREGLYRGVKQVAWDTHIPVEGSFAITTVAIKSAFRNTQFATQVAKDAIADQITARHGRRPSVRRERPGVPLHLFIDNAQAQISLDLAGESLHRRGYRKGAQGRAPLKENLAAALLLRARWPKRAAAGEGLLDPMCGTGTFLIEAALMAADCAPGLLRSYFGFHGWKGHDAEGWAGLQEEARQRDRRGAKPTASIVGLDVDRGALKAAQQGAWIAGVTDWVRLERGALGARQKSASGGGKVSGQPGAGIVVVNPPYGERLGDEESLRPLYRDLGQAVAAERPEWPLYALVGNPDLGWLLGKADQVWSARNGPIRCKWLKLDKPGDARVKRPALPAEDFKNRLRKRHKHFVQWARRQETNCFRTYDADLPDYNVAVDIYDEHVLVYEYAPPKTIDKALAERRLDAVLTAIPDVLNVPSDRVYLKRRRKQGRADQYTKLADTERCLIVQERRARFWVNLTDYLDTGLFLDHRDTRALITDLASERRFLNLFGYTGTASVCAALGGARSTTTVDLSKTYLDWAKRNFALNRVQGVGRRHVLEQADCLSWLGEAYQARKLYDLIFLDPPTFSNSKRMQYDFELQRDHPKLINRVLRLLSPDGILIFSNHFRRFKMEFEGEGEFQVEDISAATLPEDFKRNPRMRGCWKIRRRQPDEDEGPRAPQK